MRFRSPVSLTPSSHKDPYSNLIEPKHPSSYSTHTLSQTTLSRPRSSSKPSFMETSFAASASICKFQASDQRNNRRDQSPPKAMIKLKFVSSYKKGPIMLVPPTRRLHTSKIVVMASLICSGVEASRTVKRSPWGIPGGSIETCISSPSHLHTVPDHYINRIL